MDYLSISSANFPWSEPFVMFDDASWTKLSPIAAKSDGARTNERED